MNFRELSIEEEACKQARAMGVLNIKLNLQGQRGWPDRLFLVPGGEPMFIEFKRLGEAPGPLQQHRHRILRNHGYQVEVCDTVEDAVNALRQAIERTRRGR